MIDRAVTQTAIEKLCDIRLHQSLKIPAHASPIPGQSLRITYSDLGYRGSDISNGNATDPGSCVVVFIGGLVGGRYSIFRSHDIARRRKVRVLTIDRPGLGGSTPVPVAERLRVHLAVVPILLEYLHVKHVTLVSHSAGAMYLLQTVLGRSDLLHPTRPHAVLLAPWVHPNESGMVGMRLTAALPEWALGKTHSVIGFFGRNIPFVAGLSSGLSNGLSRGLSNKIACPARQKIQAGGGTGADGDNGMLEDDMILNDAALAKAVNNLIPTYVFAENTEGVSDDALLITRKQAMSNIRTARIENVEQEPRSSGHVSSIHDGADDWLNYSYCARLINDQQAKRTSPSCDPSSDSAHLRIDTIHAENDGLIGQKGAAYFDSCWPPANTPHIHFQSRIAKDVGHDEVLDPISGAAETWLQCVADRWYDDTIIG